MPTAVAAVALPHFFATALRCWRLRRFIDGDVLRRFGILSAAGSLLGALLTAPVGARGLTIILGALLVLTGILAITGAGSSWKVPRSMMWLLGTLSGLFGGLTGNQGGMRAIALLHFRLGPQAFVATATASALLVDLARTPVYLWRGSADLAGLWLAIVVATAGVLLGTLIGERVLLGLTPSRFRRLVGMIVLAIGLTVLAREL